MSDQTAQFTVDTVLKAGHRINKFDFIQRSRTMSFLGEQRQGVKKVK